MSISLSSKTPTSLSYNTKPNADLSHLNTMHLASIADDLTTLTDESQIEKAVADIKAKGQPIFILSGGSNVILPEQLHANVIRPNLRGMTVIEEDNNTLLLEVMAGEPWHDLVINTVNKGWYGLENLALIPGLTGASPIQNIGAYGVQLEDNLAYVKAFHLPTQTWHEFTKEECAFRYRDSKFKQEVGEWLITRVAFRLHKDADKTNMNYGDVAKLATEFAQKDNRMTATPIDIMQAIIQIRQSKLPDPDILPNCGSFFKNPIITTAQFKRLQQSYPDIVGYEMVDYEIDGEYTKVAAGWLIDKAGLKGKGIDPILTHAHQALVLVNHSRRETNKTNSDLKNQKVATQADIEATQQFIQQIVNDLFGIQLQREPVWIDSLANYIL